MKQPYNGEILYLDKDKKNPVRIVAVDGTAAIFVSPAVHVGRTHMGNLYDENGIEKYRI
jgi:hypothetical protein